MARTLAEDTCRLLASGKVHEPAARGVILPQPPAWNGPPRDVPTVFRVMDVGSFAAAEWLVQQRGCDDVCVLDFASDSEPGGGWRGNQTGTQEESLCRASSLGRALERLSYPIPSYGCAHVPDVVVLRDAAGVVLDAPFHVAVIAAALRDVGGDGEPDAKQRAHLQKKVAGVLAVMASCGYEHIVLGSWGCGAFGNSASLVARAFADALNGPFLNAFASVAFPDPRKPGRAAFAAVFRPLGAETVSLAAGAGGQDASESGSASRGAVAAEPPSVRRGLSAIYGAGASQHTEAVLLEWLEIGSQAQEAARRHDWSAARALFGRCVELRPGWAKGQECLARAVAKECAAQPLPALQPQTQTQTQTPKLQQQLQPPTATMAAAVRAQGEADGATSPHTGDHPTHRPTEAEGSAAADINGSAGDGGGASEELAAEAGASTDAPRARGRPGGVKLLPHERDLLASGELRDVTHRGASAVWLDRESTTLPLDAAQMAVYRPMGDEEVAHLLAHGVLPPTQPYQTIVEGVAGRQYAERYLRGSKWVDSSPTTVVEFVCPRALVARLFGMQAKPEEGCLSHGLGEKGGKGLPLFNESLRCGSTSFHIVLVKRQARCREIIRKSPV